MELNSSSSRNLGRESSAGQSHSHSASEVDAEPGAGSIIKGENGNGTSHNISQGIVIPTAENINVAKKSQTKIVFRRYPCTLWVAGTFIMLCSIYLLYHISVGPKGGTLFDGYQEG